MSIKYELQSTQFIFKTLEVTQNQSRTLPSKETGPTPRAKRSTSAWFFKEISKLLNANILSSSSTASITPGLRNFKLIRNLEAIYSTFVNCSH
jgi:hypothetical protein